MFFGATAEGKITQEEVDFASRVSQRTSRNATNGKPRNVPKFSRRSFKDDLLVAIR